MTKKVGIRDLVRNSNILDGYDYVEVVDKKTHEYKGLFVSPKYAEEFKRFLDKKISDNKQKKLNRLHKYAGKGKIQEKFNDLTNAQIREKIAEEKYGK